MQQGRGEVCSITLEGQHGVGRNGEMTMKQVERYVAARPNGDVIDELIDGVGRHSQKTLDELSEKYGELQKMTLEAACDLKIATVVTGPKEITKDYYWQMLEVMPPCRWVNVGNTESFYICEAYTLDVHSVFVRIGSRYFTMHRQVSRENHAGWVAMCKELEAA